MRYWTIFLCVVLFFGSCKSKKRVVQEKRIPQWERQSEREVETVAEPVTVVKKSKVPIDPTEAYIARFAPIAIEEMRIYKIPASITLAQGILESSSGSSELTVKSNNHFGIKCHKGWKGKKTYHDDDEKGECFRVYKDPITSYRDHSIFLVGRERYSKLFKIRKGDYVKWAKGLSEAGYATDRRYPAKLIALIEKYELYKYDAEVLGKASRIVYNEKPNIHIVVKGDTLYSISRKYGLEVAALKRMNGLKDNTISVGQSLLLAK